MHLRSQRTLLLLALLLVVAVKSFQPLVGLPRIQSDMFRTRPLASAVAEGPPLSFRDRMMRRMQSDAQQTKKKQNKKNSSDGVGRNNSSLITQVETLQEFKQLLAGNKSESLIVTWFYGPWCKACKATAPGYLSLAKHHRNDNVRFVKVPVTPENAVLHQGLGVPSVPFVHLYHPSEGLVEERKLTRKHLAAFNRVLGDYLSDSCDLERSGEWTTSDPYESVPLRQESKRNLQP